MFADDSEDLSGEVLDLRAQLAGAQAVVRTLGWELRSCQESRRRLLELSDEARMCAAEVASMQHAAEVAELLSDVGGTAQMGLSAVEDARQGVEMEISGLRQGQLAMTADAEQLPRQRLAELELFAREVLEAEFGRREAEQGAAQMVGWLVEGESAPRLSLQQLEQELRELAKEAELREKWSRSLRSMSALESEERWPRRSIQDLERELRGQALLEERRDRELRGNADLASLQADEHRLRWGLQGMEEGLRERVAEQRSQLLRKCAELLQTRALEAEESRPRRALERLEEEERWGAWTREQARRIHGEHADVVGRELAQHARSIREREAIVSGQEADVFGREAKLGEREASQKEREAGLKEREASLKEREAKVVERGASVSERETKVSEREREMNGRERDVKEREANLDSRERGRPRDTDEGSVIKSLSEQLEQARLTQRELARLVALKPPPGSTRPLQPTPTDTRRLQPGRPTDTLRSAGRSSETPPIRPSACASQEVAAAPADPPQSVGRPTDSVSVRPPPPARPTDPWWPESREGDALPRTPPAGSSRLASTKLDTSSCSASRYRPILGPDRRPSQRKDESPPRTQSARSSALGARPADSPRTSGVADAIRHAAGLVPSSCAAPRTNAFGTASSRLPTTGASIRGLSPERHLPVPKQYSTRPLVSPAEQPPRPGPASPVPGLAPGTASKDWGLSGASTAAASVAMATAAQRRAAVQREREITAQAAVSAAAEDALATLARPPVTKSPAAAAARAASTVTSPRPYTQHTPPFSSTRPSVGSPAPSARAYNALPTSAQPSWARVSPPRNQGLSTRLEASSSTPPSRFQAFAPRHGFGRQLDSPRPH
eukprot:TRINITY_DN14027_c0_g1_i2.p1 TRINITY_DN14027_c0_g1~~TRINITY_DN14027_c0_g1_i2.p1  ORF type:complete len:868 (+),score=240.97 TRINITY_DN14027_c0_g1_i2:66-2606(+)